MTLSKTEELFKEGQLLLAVKSAAEQVQQNPADEHVRVLYVELLCVNGEFEKADQQLKALMSLSPELGLAMATWRQLVHAAQIRQDVFELKAKPELIEAATPSIAHALDLLLAISENDLSKINQCLESINQQTDLNQFSINQQQPEALRDLDDTMANIFEVLGSNGKYFWVDFSQVVELEILKPTRILEVLWRKANIVLTNGTEGEVYIPANYPLKGDESASLGRETQWQENGSAYCGIGLRSWLLGDNEISINADTDLMFKNMAHADEIPQATQA